MAFIRASQGGGGGINISNFQSVYKGEVSVNQQIDLNVLQIPRYIHATYMQQGVWYSINVFIDVANRKYTYSDVYMNNTVDKIFNVNDGLWHFTINNGRLYFTNDLPITATVQLLVAVLY